MPDARANTSGLDRAELMQMRRFIGSAQAVLRAFELRIIETLDEPTPDKIPAWLPLATAAERFGLKSDTVRLWCRKEPGIGRRAGKRWEVSVPALRRRLGR
jgi:hypothetical protein